MSEERQLRLLQISVMLLGIAVIVISVGFIVQSQELNRVKHLQSQREDSWKRQIKFDDAVEKEFTALKNYIDAK